jgi:hypothetical protein
MGGFVHPRASIIILVEFLSAAIGETASESKVNNMTCNYYQFASWIGAMQNGANPW